MNLDFFVVVYFSVFSIICVVDFCWSLPRPPLFASWFWEGLNFSFVIEFLRVCVCVCVCWIIYIFFVNNNNLFLYERQFTCFFSLIFVLRVFELVFITLFARHFKNEFNGKERLLSVSRIIFTFLFLSFSFSLEPATRRRLITNNCSFPVTSCASVLPLHSLSFFLSLANIILGCLLFLG